MVVCRDCAKLGSILWRVPPPQQEVKGAVRLPPKLPVKKRHPVLTQTLELVDDFSLRVRRAREGLGLSHEDLGRRIREKVSVLRKIESGKMVPNHELATKLEHALRTKLLVPLSDPKIPSVSSSLPREATLGDVVRLKRKKTEVNKEREPS